MRERRGVAVFVPTRAEVEQIAKELGDRWPNLATAFYHGGGPVRVVRPVLDGLVKRPLLVALTPAAHPALNIRGVDTVAIYHTRCPAVGGGGNNVQSRPTPRDCALL